MKHIKRNFLSNSCVQPLGGLRGWDQKVKGGLASVPTHGFSLNFA